MGVLRLLYCDSAGVRRCRAVLHDGDLHSLSEHAVEEAAGTSSTQQPYTGVLTARSGSLLHTPSMLDAAAAGVISLKPRSQAATLNTLAGWGSYASLEDSLGIRPTASLTTSPSIAYAAAAGIIVLPERQQHRLGSQLNLGASRVAQLREAAASSSSSPLSDAAPNNDFAAHRLNSFASTSSMSHAAAAGIISSMPRRSSLKQISSIDPAPAGAKDDKQQAAFNIQSTPSLRTSSSMADAAAAGIITLPRKGSVTFAADPATKEPAGKGEPSTAAAAEAGTTAGAAVPQQDVTSTPAGSLPPAAQNAAAGASDTAAPAAASARKVKPPSPFNSYQSAAAAVAGSTASSLSSAATPSAEIPAGLSLGSCAAAAAAYSVGLTKATMGQPVYADLQAADTGLSPVGEVLLVPDLLAAVPLPWCPGHSMAPVDMMERDLRTPWSCCPRSALKTALMALELPHDLHLMVGFELEFVLLKPVQPQAAAGGGGGSGGGGSGEVQELQLTTGQGSYLPVDDSIYCQTLAFDQMAPVLDQMVATLEQMGIGVFQYHAESAPGQFEIATKPYPALEAVDKLLLSKEAISAVARQHGLQVTFLPKPFPSKGGSGLHCHFSLCQTSRGKMINVMTAVAAAGFQEQPGTTTAAEDRAAYVPGYPKLSDTASLFLAGVLSHLPALLPFTAPSVNSYQRLQPCTWSGAYSCWGWDNREAPLRLCCPRMADPGSCNAEFKAFDGSTNPYLGVAAIVAAGLTGLEARVPLPAPTQLDPGTTQPSSPAGSSSWPSLPRSLEEALEALQDDGSYKDKLEQLLGRELLRAFLAVRRDEAAAKPSISTLLFKY